MAENGVKSGDDLIKPQQPESTDPAYLAWKKAKIAAAIRQTTDFPETTLTEQEIWTKFGLDY